MAPEAAADRSPPAARGLVRGQMEYDLMGVVERIEIDGSDFHIFKNDTGVSRTIRDCGTYGFGELKIYEDALREKDLFIDVGLNIGAISFLLKKRSPRITVNGFEPIEPFLRLAQRNLFEFDDVALFNHAVGAENRFIRIEENDYDSSINFGSQKSTPGATGRLTSQISLNEFYRGDKARPRLIKVDTEGSELDVLKGADTLLHDDLIVSLEGDRPAVAREVIAFLQNFDAKLFCAILAVVDKRETSPDSPHYWRSTIHLLACFGEPTGWIRKLGREITSFDDYLHHTAPVLRGAAGGRRRTD